MTIRNQSWFEKIEAIVIIKLLLKLSNFHKVSLKKKVLEVEPQTLHLIYIDM